MFSWLHDCFMKAQGRSFGGGALGPFGVRRAHVEEHEVNGFKHHGDGEDDDKVSPVVVLGVSNVKRVSVEAFQHLSFSNFGQWFSEMAVTLQGRSFGLRVWGREPRENKRSGQGLKRSGFTDFRGPCARMTTV